MISTEFWPTLAAPLLNGIALLLALGFRRNRAFMVLAILCAASLGLSGSGSAMLFERGIEAFRMFAPCLLLATAAMPERRLLARRNLLLLSLLGPVCAMHFHSAGCRGEAARSPRRLY